MQKSNLWIRKTHVCTPCSFLYTHTHTHLFSIQHYHKHYFKKCLWTETYNTSGQQKWKKWLSKEAAAKQASSASRWLTSSLHCIGSVAVKVTAGWHPALLCVEQVSTAKAGRASFSFLYCRKSIFMKCLRFFTMLMWSWVTDLFTGQKQDGACLQNHRIPHGKKKTFLKTSYSQYFFSVGWKKTIPWVTPGK